AAVGVAVYASKHTVGSGGAGGFSRDYHAGQSTLADELLSLPQLESIAGLVLPTVTLTAPNSGTFTVGQTVTITGTASDATGIDHTWFELWKGGSQVGPIYQGANGSGLRNSYNWTVPSSLSGQTLNGTDYKVKMVCWNPSGVAGGDYSDNNLTLQPADTTG